MNQEQAKQLLIKYRLGQCTDEEARAVEDWFQHLAEDKHWDWSAEERDSFNNTLKAGIFKEIASEDIARKQQKRFPFLKLFAAAAIITVIFSVSYYYYSMRSPVNNVMAAKPVQERYKNDINAGSSGAVLTLANGKTIILDSASNGLLAVQGNTNIINKNGQLIYTGGSSDNEVLYNTIVTPKGRQYRVVLSDGTIVWLNAASSIRYPAVLGSRLREVEVTGEVYFEVAQLYADLGQASGKVPFVVTIKNANTVFPGRVEVLGTHFNINAYDDEPTVTTTLLEGRIKFTQADKEVMLSPGNQSQSDNKASIRVVQKADLDATIAWKNGLFLFDKTDIKTVMKQLARWYDIDVEYKNNRVPDEFFYVDIQRSVKLSTILKAFEQSGVKFAIEGRTVTVLY